MPQTSRAMRLNDVFAERFDAYFNAAHAGDPLWLFVHVPKTAGSSLNGELVPILSPSHHIFIDYARLDPSDAGQSYDALFAREVERFIDLAQTKKYRYCTGHINAAGLTRIMAAVPDVRPVTMIRHPVARFVSDFRYQRSPMHPGHAEFSERFPRIEDYLDIGGESNKLSSSLLPKDLYESGDARACVDWLSATYRFIGVQELYELSLHALSWFAGVPKHSKVRKRINTPTPETAVELPPDLEAEIRARNALDVAIYEAIAPRLEAVAAPLQAYLDRVAPRPPLD